MAWQRLVPWKILSMIARPRERLVPIGFGARNEDFYKLLEPRSQIWVVTRLASEFSLAGRVAVREILDRNCIPQEEWPPEIISLRRFFDFTTWKINELVFQNAKFCSVVLWGA